MIPLLLHMHQPDYRHPATGVPVMPWVRLHACRGYTDVPVLLAETGARATVNVVPSLLDQLEYYASGGTDEWERLSRKPAEDLTNEERDFVRRRFVHGQPGMRQLSRRYQELEWQVGALSCPQDLRDLQVWSNLAWMGAFARRDPRVAALRRQDRGFSHEQLLELLAFQRTLVAGVLERWSKLPEVSCSPYAHPILPLLVDFEHCRRALPQVPANAVAFAHPDDARRQVREALARVEAVLGRRPRGMWPSEGSVSPEVARILAEEGLEWAASDEGVLQRSRGDHPLDVSRAWETEGLTMVFRDRGLSDRIGFQYADRLGGVAAADLLDSVGDSTVPIILDGENPWEGYPDAGEAFLTALFSSGRTCTVGDAVKGMPRGRLQALHSGSWINANFAIWAGDPSDRRAWRHLAALRSAWDEAGRPEGVWKHLRSAQGSDWCWWYGPEHHSEMHDLFDSLYRAHLRAGWDALGQPAPQSLHAPLTEEGP